MPIFRLYSGEIPPETTPARMAKSVLRFCMNEYLQATVYLRDIGAQTPSAEYGGSRSIIFYQMLSQATNLSEMRTAHRAYRELHVDSATNHDELGGITRIAAYRLRRVPLLGKILEETVRADDATMARANFTYPDHLQNVATISELSVATPDNLRPNMHDH